MTHPPSTFAALLLALYEESRRVWAGTGRELQITVSVDYGEEHPVGTLRFRAGEHGDAICCGWIGYILEDRGLQLELLRQILARSLDAAQRVAAEEGEVAKAERRQASRKQRMGLG